MNGIQRVFGEYEHGRSVHLPTQKREVYGKNLGDRLPNKGDANRRGDYTQGDTNR